ncbi:MAG: hypothetical protein AAGD25_13130 [Cyanobacteria bacterium P01_F01_bin.150]
MIRVTGFRNPCKQLNTFQTGLMQAVLNKDAKGNLIRNAGIMPVVMSSGPAKSGDVVESILPVPPFDGLERV